VSTGIALGSAGGAKLRCAFAAGDFAGSTIVRLDSNESAREEVSDVARAVCFPEVCASAETTTITVATNIKDAISRITFMIFGSFHAQIAEKALASGPSFESFRLRNNPMT
jgi:hypothetical protein